jgi:hypothetical protein
VKGKLAAAGMSVAALVGVFVGFRLNPIVPPTAAVDPTELLQDGSFEQPVIGGPWNVAAGAKAGAFRVVDDATAADLRRVGRVTGTTISQEVLLTPVRGRAYRFALFVRRTPGNNDATFAIRAQTACASGDEIAETPGLATDRWTEVSATVQPVNGERCTMRVSIQVTGGSLDVDRGRFADAGVINPSFELGNGRESWTVDDGVTVRSASGGGVDGPRFVLVDASKPGVGIRQDAPVDPSSEPILATASVLVRASKGPVKIELQYRHPCSATIDRVDVAATSEWQRVTVRQPRLPGEAAPPSLIKVDGRGCAGQLAVVARSAGTFEVDGASLELQSYWPPEGDPSYQRAFAKKRAAVVAQSSSN